MSLKLALGETVFNSIQRELCVCLKGSDSAPLHRLQVLFRSARFKHLHLPVAYYICDVRSSGAGGVRERVCVVYTREIVLLMCFL